MEMPDSKTFKTEAIVLRSIRFGEADRILHLYTPDHGKVGAIAKGARRTKSKFGARLEPFMRVNIVLRLGRGDLHSVSGVETVAQYARLRESAAGLDWAARCCDSVSRILDGPDPHPLAYNLLANSLAAADRDPDLPGKSAQNLVQAQVVDRSRTPAMPRFVCIVRGRGTPHLVLGGGRGDRLPGLRVDRLRSQAKRSALAGRGDRFARRRRPRRQRGRSEDRRALRLGDSGTSRQHPTAAGRGAVASGLMGATQPTGNSHPQGPVADTFAARVMDNEERVLSPLAVRSYPDRRDRPEVGCGLRTPFQRDRDRIVHSKAFRRLKHKTQVFVAPLGDHYRTRLTHTLEVTRDLKDGGEGTEAQ